MSKVSTLSLIRFFKHCFENKSTVVMPIFRGISE